MEIIKEVLEIMIIAQIIEGIILIIIDKIQENIEKKRVKYEKRN